jgi:lipopolysaccharide export system ATP-binding protein
VVNGFPSTWGRGIVRLLRPNGAGKTTTFNMVVGSSSPMKGRSNSSGADLDLPMHKRARLRIGYLTPNLPSFTKLAVEQNISLWRPAR